MYLQLIYFVYLGLCCAYACYRGGRDELYGVAITLTASFLSLDPIQGQTDWVRPELALIIVDFAAFIGATLIALKSDRYWPIWFAGFCLVGAATHLSTAAMPAFAPKAYAWVVGFWAYPAIACLVIGARNHHRLTQRRRAVS